MIGKYTIHGFYGISKKWRKRTPVLHGEKNIKKPSSYLRLRLKSTNSDFKQIQNACMKNDFGQTVDTIFVCLYPIQRRYLTLDFPWIKDPKLCVHTSTTSWWFQLNPFEKSARQIGSFPEVGVKNKKCLKPPPGKWWKMTTPRKINAWNLNFT